jgi:hypothetical protein
MRTKRHPGPFRSTLTPARILGLLLAAAVLLTGAAAMADDAARDAASTAVAEHGGRVLKVEAVEGGHRVKLLLPSGKVKVVRVGPNRRGKGEASEPDRPQSRRGERGASSDSWR